MKANIGKRKITSAGLSCSLRDAEIGQDIFNEVVSRIRAQEHILLEQESMKVIQKNMKLIDATVLLALHEKFGFGKERLERLFKAVNEITDEYQKRYGCGYSVEEDGGNQAIDEIDNRDNVIFVMERDLKEIGVPLEEWIALYD